MPPTPPAAGTELFTGNDLTEWLGETVTDGKAVVVEQVVWGWLKPKLGLEERPNPVKPEVFSWAVELGAIAHVNPAGYSAEQLGPAQRQFSSERRNEILDAAEGFGSGSPPLAPQGDFPPAPEYPDPARVCNRQW